jgi:hypothetical protein
MKFINTFIFAVLMVTGVAHAQLKPYTTLEYSQETKRATGDESDKGGLVVGLRDKSWDYSLKTEYSQDQEGTGNSTGVEARVRYSFAPMTQYEIRPYVGVRLGERFKGGSNFSHYAVDYGIKFPVIGRNVYLDLGGRYRNAFQSSQEFQSTRAHAQLSWNITDKDTVAVRYSRSYGDVSEEKNAYRLSYTRSF